MLWSENHLCVHLLMDIPQTPITCLMYNPLNSVHVYVLHYKQTIRVKCSCKLTETLFSFSAHKACKTSFNIPHFDGSLKFSLWTLHMWQWVLVKEICRWSVIFNGLFIGNELLSFLENDHKRDIHTHTLVFNKLYYIKILCMDLQ